MDDAQLKIVCKAARRFAPRDIEIDDWTHTMIEWILRNERSYDPARGAYSTWVYQIIRRERGHHVRRQIERRKAMRVCAIGNNDIAAATGQTLEGVESANTIALDVRQAMRRCLPHELYAVQSFLDGTTFTEAGKKVGLTRAAISRNWRIALVKMKQELRRMGHGSNQANAL